MKPYLVLCHCIEVSDAVVQLMDMPVLEQQQNKLIAK